MSSTLGPVFAGIRGTAFQHSIVQEAQSKGILNMSFAPAPHLRARKTIEFILFSKHTSPAKQRHESNVALITPLNSLHSHTRALELRHTHEWSARAHVSLLRTVIGLIPETARLPDANFCWMPPCRHTTLVRPGVCQPCEPQKCAVRKALCCCAQTCLSKDCTDTFIYTLKSASI